MENGRLDKEMISQPQLWRLVMMLSATSLDVALFPPVQRESIIWRSFPLDPSAESPLKALEDVVYDNPLLLCDFKQVQCIVDNVPQVAVPAALSEEDLELILPPEPSAGAVELYSIGDPDVMIALRQDLKINAFLRRTFFNITFESRLASLCRYFLDAAQAAESAESVSIWAPARDGRLTLIATRGAKLLLANTFTTDNDADGAYYILASMQQLGADPKTASVALGRFGSPSPGLAERLTPYVADLRPLPFPTLRHRAAPATLQAPLELLIQS